jgi:hypothetical protein
MGFLGRFVGFQGNLLSLIANEGVGPFSEFLEMVLDE